MSDPQMIPIDLSYKLDFFKDLTGRVAIITGGSRGIGRCCALKLASLGCNIAVAAKTTTPHPTLPGTIQSVAKECEALGVKAIPVRVDLRSEEEIKQCVQKVIDTFGRIDILINNASALWWQEIKDTPAKRYDMIHSINARGTFLITKECLPHMEKNGFGRVVTMAPPIATKGFAGRTAYNISKMGMTMVSLGVAEEYAKKNITGNSLWPVTVIESYASINFKLGERKMWRKAEVIADATIGIICEEEDFTGQMLFDEDYLRYKGFSDKDFVRYRCDPNFEPPKALVGGSGELRSKQILRRGSVARLEKDMEKSKGIWRREDTQKSKL